MKNYELTYLVSPDLSGEQVQTLTEKIADYVTEETGIIIKTPKPSKVSLGYLIKEKGEAFLVSIDFSLNPEKITNIEKNILKEGDILRHLVIIKEGKKETPVRKRIKPKTDEPQSEKVELKEIDKKIEEILQ